MGIALGLVVAGLALLLVARLGLFAFAVGLGMLPVVLIVGGVIWAVSAALAGRRGGNGAGGDGGAPQA